MTIRIFTSHLGYDRGGAKRAIVGGLCPGTIVDATLVDAEGTRRNIVASPAVPVDRWHGGAYSTLDFSPVEEDGVYYLEARTDGELVRSEEFAIGTEQIHSQGLSDVLFAFKAGRSSGEIDRKDTAARRWNDSTDFVVDARGGWLDASGDTSKFLSHLTYSPTMSPQQIPLCVWGMMEARDQLIKLHPRYARALGTRLRDEALYGADFLVRFRAPEGYFYTGIFDGLTKELDQRIINAPLPESVRTDRYQASYRGGGGMAIAALARAARERVHGDFTQDQYLEAAQHAFTDLERNNSSYLFNLDLDTGALTDSSESIVDDFCALIAATELHATDPQERYAEAAKRRAANLVRRYRRENSCGWFQAWDDGRPYFSAAESGLPIIALLKFAEQFPDDAADCRLLAIEAMRDTLTRTDAVGNPFGYPRQRVQSLGEDARDSFFFPHRNDTGYWWQGENANLASMSFAASQVASVLEPDSRLRERLEQFAVDQVYWILGRNPFDVCMLQGRGRGNVDYSPDYPNLPGGIINGITGGLHDEHDISFVTSEQDTWRWTEQWIPHSAWYLMAVSALPTSAAP